MHPKQNILDKKFRDFDGNISRAVDQKPRIRVVITKGKRKASDNVCRYCEKAHSTDSDLYKHYMNFHRLQYSLDKKNGKTNPSAIIQPDTRKAEDKNAQSQSSLNYDTGIIPMREESRMAGKGSNFTCVATKKRCLATKHEFKTNKELIEHYARYHPECCPQFRCEFCQRIYPTLSELNQHRQSAHIILDVKLAGTQPPHRATLHSVNAVSEVADSNHISPSVTPLPLCIVDCPGQGQDGKQAELVSYVGKSGEQEPNHTHILLSDFYLTEKSEETNTNVIEIQPIPDFSEKLINTCVNSGDGTEEMVAYNPPCNDDNNTPCDHSAESYEFKDEPKEEIKCDMPAVEVKNKHITHKNNSVKDESKDNKIHKVEVVLPTKTELSTSEIENGDNIQKSDMKCEGENEEIKENKVVFLTKTETSDGLKTESMIQEYSEEYSPRWETCSNVTEVTKRFEIPSDTQISQNKIGRVEPNGLFSWLSCSAGEGKSEIGIDTKAADPTASRGVPINKIVALLPKHPKQAVRVLGNKRVRAPANRGPMKRKHCHSFSTETNITKSPLKHRAVLQKVQLSQSTNTRLSEQRLLLSGDIEQNPGPLIQSDTRWTQKDIRRGEQDSSDWGKGRNDRLSEQRLLLSGDVERNPGPQEGSAKKVGILSKVLQVILCYLK